MLLPLKNNRISDQKVNYFNRIEVTQLALSVLWQLAVLPVLSALPCLEIPQLLNFYRKKLFPCLFIFLFLGISGCNNKPLHPPSPVIAKVNGIEITEQQLNLEEAITKGTSKKQILEVLINRLLFVEAAKSIQLDQDPKIKTELERQQSTFLAMNYVKKKVLPSIPKPSPEEIQAFYNKRPDLFANRKLWKTFEFTLNPEDIKDGLQDKIKSVNTPEDTMKLLNQEHITFSSTIQERTVSDFPENYSIKIYEGSKFLISNGAKTGIIFVIASRSAPLSLQDATPLIENYFTNTQSEEKTKNVAQKLRSAAVIEYFDLPSDKASSNTKN